MNHRTKKAARMAMLGWLFAWFCTGCHKNVAVPGDCQSFLDQFFLAIKSSDAGKLQDLSFPERVMNTGEMPQETADRVREEHRKMNESQLAKMKQMFGDFESYSVESVDVGPLTASDMEFIRMQGAKDVSAGTRAVIVCSAKFSKTSGRFAFELIQQAPASEYLYESYRFEAQ